MLQTGWKGGSTETLRVAIQEIQRELNDREKRGETPIVLTPDEIEMVRGRRLIDAIKSVRCRLDTTIPVAKRIVDAAREAIADL